MFPFLKKLSTYIRKEHYSNFGTFEIVSLVNVPGQYLRKYGMLKHENGSLPDLHLPDTVYEKTTTNYILGKYTAD